MIDIANKYKELLAIKLLGTWYDLKYKYYHARGYYKSLPDIPDNDWNERHFVIINNEEIIGYINYSINRQTRIVSELEAVNFSDKKEDILQFGVGMRRILKDIFEVHGMNKIIFSVVIGNPIEKSYDKLIKRYGGRIVGIYYKDIILVTGEICDFKFYEIMKEEYFNNK